MFKKCISYLIIFSLLYANTASCMKRTTGGDPDNEGQSSSHHRSMQIQEEISSTEENPSQEQPLQLNSDVQAEPLEESLMQEIGEKQSSLGAPLVQSIDTQQEICPAPIL